MASRTFPTAGWPTWLVRMSQPLNPIESDFDQLHIQRDWFLFLIPQRGGKRTARIPELPGNVAPHFRQAWIEKTFSPHIVDFSESIDKREFLFGLLKWSTLVLLLFAISAVTTDRTQVFSRSVTVP